MAVKAERIVSQWSSEGVSRVNVINLEDRTAARLAKKAAAYGMDVVREPAGTWALVAWGFRTPELSGVTLREIEADLDSCEELELQFIMEMSEA